MKTNALLLMCTLFALATAKPWYDRSSSYISKAQSSSPHHGHKSGYFDSEGYYHHSQAKTSQISENSLSLVPPTIYHYDESNICKSAKYKSGDFFTYIHVCESGESRSGELTLIKIS